MLRALFRGGFIGGLTAFLWTAFSWSVLGWHQAAIHPLADEAAAAAFLRTQTPVSGVYLLPDPHHAPAGLPEDSLKTRWERQAAATQRGPVAFLAVRAQGQDLRNPAWMANTLGIHLLGAGLLTLLLWPLRHAGFWRRWSLLLLAVAAGGVINQLPDWNWWHAGPAWTLTTLADLLLGWGLAGLVIAWATGAGIAFTAERS